MSDDPRSTMGLAHLLQLVAEQSVEGVFTMLPGQVSSYSSTDQTASVQPLIKKAHVSEKEVRVAQTLPEIHEVPVWFFGASSKGRITVPVEKGHLGMIVFSCLAMEPWKRRGGIVDPKNDRRHDANDCVFVPGLHVIGKAPTTAPTDAMVLHGLDVRIGGPTGAEKMVKGETYIQAEDILVAGLKVVMGAISTFAGNCVGPTGPQLTALQGAITLFQGLIDTFRGANASYLALRGRVV